MLAASALLSRRLSRASQLLKSPRSRGGRIGLRCNSTTTRWLVIGLHHPLSALW